MSLWTDFRDAVTSPIAAGVKLANQGLQVLFKASLPDLEFDRSIKITKEGTDQPVPVVYGRAEVGGVLVFDDLNGSDRWLVNTLCEGEIDAVESVLVDEVDSGDSRFTGKLTLTHHTGTDTQSADSALVAAITKWTTAHQGKGIAYSTAKMTYDPDVFGARPLFKTTLRGKKLYDTRTSTSAYSANRMLALYDYLTNTRYGLGIPSANIDTASVSTVANDCETQLETFTGSGVFINQDEANGVIDTGANLIENLKRIKGGRIRMSFINGQYVFAYRKASAKVMTLAEGTNIVGDISWRGADKSELANRVSANFINPQTRWERDSRVVESATFLTQDGGELLEKQLDLALETDPYRAEYKADVALKTSRLGLTCSLGATMAAWQLVPGDVVGVTHASPGWTDKLFTVERMTIDPFSDGPPIRLELREYDATVWDRTVPASAYVPPVTTGLVDPTTVIAPTAVTAASGSAHQLTMADGTVIKRVLVGWTATTDPYATRYEIEGKVDTTGTWGDFGPVIVDRIQTSVYLSPVQDGTAYLFRVRAINAHGYSSAWAVLGSAHTVAADTGTKLAGIAPGADVTAANTAAAIAGQGAYATVDQVTTSNVDTLVGDNAITLPYSVDNITPIDLTTLTIGVENTLMSLRTEIFAAPIQMMFSAAFSEDTGEALSNIQSCSFKISITLDGIGTRGGVITPVFRRPVTFHPRWGDTFTYSAVMRFVGYWQASWTPTQWPSSVGSVGDSTALSAYCLIAVENTSSGVINLFAATTVTSATGATAPAFNHTLDSTTTDGGVTWTCWGDITSNAWVFDVTLTRNETAGGNFSDASLAVMTAKK